MLPLIKGREEIGRREIVAMRDRRRVMEVGREKEEVRDRGRGRRECGRRQIDAEMGREGGREETNRW